MHRITSHPLFEIEKGSTVSFTFNGKTLSGHQGESLATALWANGISTLSRSEKYHRPRGLFCLSGYCSHCLMRVDGIPNTRTCQTPLKEGMVVESQNAWPSINFDLAASSVFFSRLLRPGFYYRYLKRPRFLYQIYEKALRKMAGSGTIAAPGAVKFAGQKSASPQVLVIGAGYSGMQAAISAAEAGADVTILEREDEAGGLYRYDNRPIVHDQQTAFSNQVVEDLADRLYDYPNITLLRQAKALSWHIEEQTLIAMQPELRWDLTPRSIIVATGSYETPLLFENPEVPGIMLSRGVLRLMHRDFVRPGDVAVLHLSTLHEPHLAKQLMDAGVRIQAITSSQAADPDLEAFASQNNIPLYLHHRLVKSRGRTRIKKIVVSPIGREETMAIKCDCLVVQGESMPANELAFQYTNRGTFLLEARFQLTQTAPVDHDIAVAPGMYMIGKANQCHEPVKKQLQAKQAGLMAAGDSGLDINQEMLDTINIKLKESNNE